MSADSTAVRAERERRAYDEDRVWENHHRWVQRVVHVVRSPNTRRYERVWDDLAREAARGGRVLDVGCGHGISSKKLLDMGAERVLGVDVAQSAVERARELERPGRLEFRVADVAAGVEGEYDLVFGRAVIHHLDLRPTVRRLYEQNLAPGGTMMWMEPLGVNLITRAFHRLTPRSHTPDERPVSRDDLRWIASEFPGSQLIPINYFSYPAGILSSFLFRSPDNPLTRAADRVDEWIARRVPRLGEHFRQGIIVIRKPAAT